MHILCGRVQVFFFLEIVLFREKVPELNYRIEKSSDGVFSKIEKRVRWWPRVRLLWFFWKVPSLKQKFPEKCQKTEVFRSLRSRHPTKVSSFCVAGGPVAFIYTTTSYCECISTNKSLFWLPKGAKRTFSGQFSCLKFENFRASRDGEHRVK